jgi:hypothetical protein
MAFLNEGNWAQGKTNLVGRLSLKRSRGLSRGGVQRLATGRAPFDTRLKDYIAAGTPQRVGGRPGEICLKNGPGTVDELMLC